MSWLADIVESSLSWIADRFGLTLDLRGLAFADEEILTDLEYGRT